jgi:hypothetical protein
MFNIDPEVILAMAEGEGFEPPEGKTLNGFQDRRIQPLCHPSKRRIISKTNSFWK